VDVRDAWTVCDAGPTVTFPVIRHHCPVPVTGTKWYRLWRSFRHELGVFLFWNAYCVRVHFVTSCGVQSRL